jgi:hypothetical protein
MSRNPRVIIKCDRCGAIADIPPMAPSYEYEWGRIRVEQCNGPKLIGGQKEPDPAFRDLCPACLNDVYGWFHSLRAQREP